MTNATDTTGEPSYEGLHVSKFRAMGSDFEMWVASVDASEARRALDAAHAFVDRAEAVMSRFRPESELCRMNALAGRETRLSSVLLEAIVAALDAARITAGLYDPTLLSAVVNAGYDRPFDELAPHGATAGPTVGGKGCWSEVRIDLDAGTVRLPMGAGIDLGGIGKAWAAHRTAQMLAGTGPCIVSAGGDVAVCGEPYPGERWPVGVADPFHPGENLTVVEVTDCGVATSGTDHRRWKAGGVESHHLIDPRTGLPAQTDLVSATVFAPDVLTAEAFALAVMVAGEAGGTLLLDAHPRLDAVLVTDDGQVLDRIGTGAIAGQGAT